MRYDQFEDAKIDPTNALEKWEVCNMNWGMDDGSSCFELVSEFRNLDRNPLLHLSDPRMAR